MFFYFIKTISAHQLEKNTSLNYTTLCTHNLLKNIGYFYKSTFICTVPMGEYTAPRIRDILHSRSLTILENCPKKRPLTKLEIDILIFNISISFVDELREQYLPKYIPLIPIICFDDAIALICNITDKIIKHPDFDSKIDSALYYIELAKNVMKIPKNNLRNIIEKINDTNDLDPYKVKTIICHCEEKV